MVTPTKLPPPDSTAPALRRGHRRISDRERAVSPGPLQLHVPKTRDFGRALHPSRSYPPITGVKPNQLYRTATGLPPPPPRFKNPTPQPPTNPYLAAKGDPRTSRPQGKNDPAKQHRRTRTLSDGSIRGLGPDVVQVQLPERRFNLKDPLIELEHSLNMLRCAIEDRNLQSTQSWIGSSQRAMRQLLKATESLPQQVLRSSSFKKAQEAVVSSLVPFTYFFGLRMCGSSGWTAAPYLFETVIERVVALVYIADDLIQLLPGVACLSRSRLPNLLQGILARRPPSHYDADCDYVFHDFDYIPLELLNGPRKSIDDAQDYLIYPSGFEHDPNIKPVIVYASLPAIVSLLTQDRAEHDVSVREDLNEIFFCCLHFFDSKELFYALVQKYRPPLFSTTTDSRTIENLRCHGHTQRRVLAILTAWVTKCWRFADDDPVHEFIWDFASSERVSGRFPAECRRLLQGLNALQYYKKTKRLIGPRPLNEQRPSANTPKGPRRVDVDRLNAEAPDKAVQVQCGLLPISTIMAELMFDDPPPGRLLTIARQLTLMAHNLFVEVSPEGMLTHESKHENCSTCRVAHWRLKVAQYSDNITSWVTRAVVDEEDLDRRVTIFKTFVELAELFSRQHDFHSLCSIMNGLIAVSGKLTHTLEAFKERFPRDFDLYKQQKMFHDTFCNQGTKHAMDIMEKSLQPMVPMLSVFTQVYERVLRGGFMFVTSKQTQKRVHHIRQYGFLTQAVRLSKGSYAASYDYGPMPEFQRLLRVIIYADQSTPAERATEKERIWQKMQEIDPNLPPTPATPVETRPRRNSLRRGADALMRCITDPIGHRRSASQGRQ